MLESPTKAAEISPPLPLQAPEAAELTEQLLREQAELQARFGLVSVDVGPRQRAAAERRQTTTLEHLRAVAELESDDEAEVMPEVGTHRERLRRQQERKRRRQTIAALKQRRSSWRGWTASVPELLSSPPQSPTGHMPASPSPVPTTADTAVNSADAPSFSLLPICPASASAMYPPPAWNHAADSKSFDRSQPTTSSSPDRMLPTRRRLTDTNHAYPPRPLPIDAGWELVDNRDMPDKPDHDTFESDVGQPSSELHSQSVDLHAVPVPITDALGNRDTLSESADPALGPIIVQPPPVFSPPRTRSATTLKSSLASSRAGSTTSLNPKKATLPKPKAIAAPKAKAATIPNTKAKTPKSKTAAAPSKPGPATSSKPKTAAEREINSPAPSDSADTSLVGGHALRSAPRKRKADKPAPKPAQPKRTRAQPKPASPPHTRSSKRTKRP
ncbi:hypothetical protein GGF43_006184 [Coemansia sp. RSA 2618]|nr:hypothetical protein GGF43_006184 [Coemansia sp. RSA 2618]